MGDRLCGEKNLQQAETMPATFSPEGKLLTKARQFTKADTKPEDVTNHLLAENRKLPEADRVDGDRLWQFASQVITERDERKRSNGKAHSDYAIPQPPNGMEFMAKKFPPRKKVLGPLTTSSLVHAAGDTGVGKTMVAIAMTNALCTGSGMFNWQGYHPVTVLHIDAEMPGDMLQERVNLFEWGEHGLVRQRMLSVADYCAEHELTTVNLADPEWQERIVYLAQDVDVVNLDNFFSLVSVPGISLASDEHYAPIRPLLVRLRAMGKLVILWDHTNAEGRAFGTRTKGWICDCVFTLSKDKEALTDEVVFTLAFTKTRGKGGRDYWPFNAKLLTDRNGKATWLVKLEEEAQMQQAWDLQKGGATQREISKELEISLGKVNKLLKKARKVEMP